MQKILMIVEEEITKTDSESVSFSFTSCRFIKLAKCICTISPTDSDSLHQEPLG